MKRLVVFCCGLTLCLFLSSWSRRAHRVICLIAELHLNGAAKAQLHSLLGTETLAGILSRAGEPRVLSTQPGTTPGYFLSLPPGLSYTQFIRAIQNQPQPNVYSALLGKEKLLGDIHAPASQRIAALKMLIWLVSELHEPMQPKAKQSNGGNTIPVGGDTNLPEQLKRGKVKGDNMTRISFQDPMEEPESRDTRLIEQEGLSDIQLAKKIDRAGQRHIRQWQHDPPLLWLWESYRLSTQFDERGNAYDGKQKELSEQRLEKAGVRLAGVLNELLKGASR